MKKDIHIKILEYAEGKKEGFTMNELKNDLSLSEDVFRSLLSERSQGELFVTTSVGVNRGYGTENLLMLSFKDKAQLLTHRMVSLTNIIAVLTTFMIIGLGVQIWFVLKQTEYMEVQTRSDRILQAQFTSDAIKRCKQDPSLQESGLNNTETGGHVSCEKVIEIFNISLDSSNSNQ